MQDCFFFFLLASVPPTEVSNPQNVDFKQCLIFLIFLQIHGDVLHPLHHEEAERSGEAQDDHQQELPHQEDVAAVEKRHGCKNRLSRERRFYLVV